MPEHILFHLVFLSQIVLISFYLVERLMGQEMSHLSANMLTG